MNLALQEMLKRYESRHDHIKALNESLQKIALLGLWRSKFFEIAAFYGGSCLRILYGSERFSESLNFSLLHSYPKLDASEYMHAIKVELESFGLGVTVEPVEKTEEVLKQIFTVGLPKEAKNLSIKIAINLDPHFQIFTDQRYVLEPIPFSVRSFSEPDLFVNHLFDRILSPPKKAVKGRDWFDFIWFIQHRIPVHLKKLEERLKQNGQEKESQELTEQNLKSLLESRIAALDVEQAKKDARAFIQNSSAIEVWSKELFLDLVQNIHTV